MLTKPRQHISRTLTGCWVALWLAGSLSVAQGSLLPQWNMPHCPQGQTQNGQHNHTHCVWHCGGLDIQRGGGREETSADIHLGRIWTIGNIPVRDAVVDGEFPPRGPPRILKII
jgi:hypothetical protein